MKKYLILVCLTYFVNLSAQNGKIVDEVPYVIADTSLAKIQKNFPETELVIKNVQFSRITYLSDGLKVVGYTAVPKKPGKYPCIIYNRGGNRQLGQLEAPGIYRFLGIVASWGYVVVASQYRGNDGGEGKEEFGGKDVNDVLNLIPLLNNIPAADPSRIGMYGWSRGGMMTYLALTKTNQIKAAVIGGGMSDAWATLQERPQMETLVFSQLIPNYAANKEAVLKERSAVNWPEKISKTTPLLLLHGSADWRVNIDQAFKMSQKLYSIKHPFRLMTFEGGDHGLTEHLTAVDYNVRNFLDSYVRDGKPWPSLQPHGD